MDKLLISQENIMRRIQCFKENFLKLEAQNITKGVVISRIDLLNGYWKKFSETHENLFQGISAAEQAKLEYFGADQYLDCENNYLEVMAYLRDYQERFDTSSNTANRSTISATLNDNSANISGETSSTERRVGSRINIPKFSGLYTEWISFKDLFTSLIDQNRRLSKAQKLHYLRASVSGEAASLLENIPICDGNYVPAWELLSSRYNNTRMLVYHHLKTLFNLPAMTSNSSDELRCLLNGTKQSLKIIQTLDRPVQKWDDLIVFITTEKLVLSIREDWERQISSTSDMPTLANLETFLLNRLRMLDAIKSPQTDYKPVNKSSKRHSSRQVTSECPLCKVFHLLLFCPVFRQYSISERRAFIAKEYICFNCLRYGHNRKRCTSTHRCRTCNDNHHTMLHPTEVDQTDQPVKVQSTQAVYSHVAKRLSFNKQILLATALVNVSCSNGITIQLRALLDQGSEASFISESACQVLNLPRKKNNTRVSGIGAQGSVTTRGLVTFQLASRVDSSFSVEVEALVLRTLTNGLPTTPCTGVIHWPLLQEVQLADPNFYQSKEVDLILGTDIYAQIILPGLERDHTNSLLAQNTKLGWIISGACTNSNKLPSTTINSYCCSLSQLDEQRRRFCETEEVVEKRKPTQEELQCEDYFLKTHYSTDGRYVVRLPKLVPDDSLNLGKSRSLAVHRFTQVERRFLLNPKLKDAYCSFMSEYLSLGHNEPISRSDISTKPSHNTYYQPHHGVFKNQDLSGKFRVVFNGSQKTSNGCSLNGRLFAGPKLHQDVWSIVTRFKEHQIVFIIDIEKMFPQIWVNELDLNLQRIVWRNPIDEPIRDFKLKTVSYGTVPALYLTIRTLHQLAADEKSSYPSASQVLIRDCYVDDIDQLKNELIKLLNFIGFTLKKWPSNSSELLREIPPEHREKSSILSLGSDADNTIKTLGILWQPTDIDPFSFKVQLLHNSAIVTKHKLLSDISRFFDPLGFLTPSIIIDKVMLQKLWLTRLGWDVPLPTPLLDEWMTFREVQPLFEHIRIPRWLGTMSSQLSFALHGFPNASNTVYAAVVHVRVSQADNPDILTQLIPAKSKVAPVKTVSIPRLELAAAVLLTRLLSKLKPVFNITPNSTVAWIDSSTVLSWLRANPSRWKTNVAKGVSEIQKSTNISQWRYVPLEDNPADCASRGLRPGKLPNFTVWWQGPSWLQQHVTHWPSELPIFSRTEDLEENKTTALHVRSAKGFTIIIERYSSLTKLIRIEDYVHRFCYNCRLPHSHRQTKILSTTELQDSLACCIFSVQLQCFFHEVKLLSEGKHINQNSPTLRLCPFMDGRTLLRVGGRLKNSKLPYAEKYPIILPKKDHCTTLIVKHYHELTLHGRTQLTLCQIRRRYWILDGRNTVRQYIHLCIPCFRQAALWKDQLMGSLPPNRVRSSQPFQQNGLAYPGPITIKIHKWRGFKTKKGYIALFICLSTKSLHLELVGDLTSESFIASFRRFTSGRGICTDLYSDRGTNFIDADAELKTRPVLSKICDVYRVPELLSNYGTNWHFIPLHSPQFGGIWKLAVKSVKHHLRRIVGDTRLTFEEMTTFLCQIEAELNSTLIYPLIDDPDDLAPGHFLIDRPITALPEPSLLHVNTNRLSRWQQTQKVLQEFWKRWSGENLNCIEQRNKWNTIKPANKINDLVLIKDDHYPPCKWPISRVVAVHPGTDDLLRVATLRTQNSTILRPIVKLLVLPFSEEDVHLRERDEGDSQQTSFLETHFKTTASAGGQVNQ